MAIVTAHATAAKAVWMLTRNGAGAYRVTLSSDIYPYGEELVHIDQLLIGDLAELHDLLGEELVRREQADTELELRGGWEDHRREPNEA